MRVCLVYHLRLGDIIRILPIARCLASQGHSVYVECLEPYWGLFSAVSYARPARPEDRDSMRYGRVIDLQVWPRRYEDYRRSGKPWSEFVFGLFPEFAGLDRRPVFDLIDEQPTLAEYGKPRDICLLAGFGYSQGRQYNFGALCNACFRLTRHRIVFLVDALQLGHLREQGVADDDMLCAKSPGDLPRLIRDAADFFTVNSAPCVIAGAVRSDFWHVPSGIAQDDQFSEASQVVTIGD
jgi:hypothetical protein